VRLQAKLDERKQSFLSSGKATPIRGTGRMLKRSPSLEYAYCLMNALVLISDGIGERLRFSVA